MQVKSIFLFLFFVPTPQILNFFRGCVQLKEQWMDSVFSPSHSLSRHNLLLRMHQENFYFLIFFIQYFNNNRFYFFCGFDPFGR
jgi:hypothetical protein